MKREKGSRMRLPLQPRQHLPWWLLFLGLFVPWPLRNKVKEFQERSYKGTVTGLQ